MLSLASRNVRRQRIHLRIRSRVRGRAQVPRLSVFRSLQHIYAQVVDDSRGHTLVGVSSRDKEVQKTLKTGGNVSAARVVGKVLAERIVAYRDSKGSFVFIEDVKNVRGVGPALFEKIKDDLSTE